MTALDSAAGPSEPEPLLERDDELRAIAALLADAHGARGRLLLIEAPAGLGKSSLAERAAVLAHAEGVGVLRAAGHELERGFGWGVARSLFEPWLQSLPHAERDELLDGPVASARVLFEYGDPDGGGRPASEVSFGILHGLHWLAVRLAERAPRLLVVDDAHSADELSLRFLVYLLARVRDQPLGMLVAARTAEHDEGGLLAQLAADRGTTVLGLASLGPDAVAALVRARVPRVDDAFCRRCSQLTAGNPLGVRELVAAIAGVGPATPPAGLDVAAERAARSLSRSVLARLAALPADAGALAVAVAAFEGGIALHTAAELAGLGPVAALDAADALARADILVPDDPLDFTHPLLRAAVYGALGRHERGEMHGRAGRLLLELGAPIEQVGAHLLEATPTGDRAVVDALGRAADSALSHGVPTSAIAYLERALREPPATAARPDVLAALGRAQLIAGRRDAVAQLEAAIALVGEPRRRAGLHLELGRTLHDFGRLEEACAAFERGVSDIEADGSELALELQDWYLGSAMLLADRALEAHGRVDAILAGSERGATQAGRVLASKAMSMRLYAGGPRDELVALALRVYADGRLLDETGIASQAVGHVGGTLSYCDEYERSSEVLDRAIAWVQRRGWVTWYAAALQLRARQTLWTGPLAEVIEDSATAVDIFAAGQQMYLPASCYCLARAHLEADRPEEPRRCSEGSMLSPRPADCSPPGARRPPGVWRRFAATSRRRWPPS